MFSVAKNYCCFYTAVRNQGRKFVEVCYVFKFSIGIHQCVPYRRPNLPAISEMVLFSCFIILKLLAMFSCEHHSEGQPEMLSVFN
jgi:hypothetical protein